MLPAITCIRWLAIARKKNGLSFELSTKSPGLQHSFNSPQLTLWMNFCFAKITCKIISIFPDHNIFHSAKIGCFSTVIFSQVQPDCSQTSYKTGGYLWCLLLLNSFLPDIVCGVSVLSRGSVQLEMHCICTSPRNCRSKLKNAQMKLSYFSKVIR